MKTILILMDSLNRHYLNAYSDSFIYTPSLDRLFSRGVKFNSHYCCSMPCMPARRDLFTGRATFLETPWGSLEPYDESLPRILRENNIYTHMITDHYHYFEGGGAGYYQAFDTWELERGQEGDVWHPLVKHPEIPEFRGKNRRAYWVNKEFSDWEKEEDYPTPKCFQDAINFLDNNHDSDDWHLHLEVFDPHEPFVCPKKYKDMYNDTWDKFYFDWPSYSKVDPIEGEEGIEHIRKCYAGVLTMADTWLGKFLDKMDEYNLWNDTCVILTTDHGHLLGEHGYWAKNYMFDYQELTNIPLCICINNKNKENKEVNALTSAIDIMPTLLSLHNIDIPKSVQGKSLMDLVEHKKEALHKNVIYGYFGKDVNMFNGTYTYCRQPIEDSDVDVHTMCFDKRDGFYSEEDIKNAEFGCFLSHTNVPQLKIKHKSTRHADSVDYNPIYNILLDAKQEKPIQDDGIEQVLAKELQQALEAYKAPECQWTRLGLDKDEKEI